MQTYINIKKSGSWSSAYRFFVDSLTSISPELANINEANTWDQDSTTVVVAAVVATGAVVVSMTFGVAWFAVMTVAVSTMAIVSAAIMVMAVVVVFAVIAMATIMTVITGLSFSSCCESENQSQQQGG